MSGNFYTTPIWISQISDNEYPSDSLIDTVLTDNRMFSIKDTAEFKANLNPETLGNRFITYIFPVVRVIWLLRYRLVYLGSIRDG